MNLEQFYNLKAQITKDLQRKLDLSKDMAVPYSVVTDKKTQIFRLERYATSEQQLNLLAEVVAFAKQVNGEISHDSHDDGAGRVGYYSHTTIAVRYTKLMTEVDEELVKKQMHKALKGMMGLNSYSYIDCKVMQLFKDGKIDWETVVASHKGECSL